MKLLSLLFLGLLIHGCSCTGVLAQTDPLYVNQISGVYSQKNLVKNGLFEKNASGVTSTGNSSASWQPSTSMFGKGLLSVVPGTTGEARIAIDVKPGGLAGKNCELVMNMRNNSLGSNPVRVSVKSNGVTLVTRDYALNQPIDPITGNYQTIPVSGLIFPCSALTGTNDFVTFERVSGSTFPYVDNVYVGESISMGQIGNVTSESSYTPVAPQGLGTLSSVDLKYWIVGSKLYVRGAFTTGTVSSSEARLDLPAGFTTKADTVTNTIIGKFGRGSAQTAHGGFILKQNNVGYVLFSASSAFGGTSSNSLSPELGTNVFANSEKVSVEFSVEVNGLSATSTISTQQCLQDGSCENVFSAKVSSAGVVSGENIDWINGNASITNTSTFALTFNTNFFGAAPTCVATSVQGIDAADVNIVERVAATSSGVSFRTLNDLAATATDFRIICQRSGTDYKPRFAAAILTGSVTSNSPSALRVEAASITSTGVVTELGTSDWISGNCTNANPIVCTFVTNTFTATPVCQITRNGLTGAVDTPGIAAISSSSISYSFHRNGTGETLQPAHLTCIGPRFP